MSIPTRAQRKKETRKALQKRSKNIIKQINKSIKNLPVKAKSPRKKISDSPRLKDLLKRKRK